jgi:hypothetical protein
MDNPIQKLIEKSHKQRQQQAKYHNFSSIEVFIDDPLPENIDLNNVFSFINSRIPPYILELVKSVHIGHYRELEDRHINAMYSDGTIYITNDQKSDNDVIDDIIHELAHAVEDHYGKEVYLSGEIEQEFLGKRKKLERLLRYMDYDTHLYDFENPQYLKKFDFFLLKGVGYDIIESLTIGLFINPYAVTSLREYFATGFEDYYLNNGDNIRETSPQLYRVLEELNNME